MLKEIMAIGKMPTKLHFGCGIKIKDGYWNVDSNILDSFYQDHSKDTWVSEGNVVSPHTLPNDHFDYILAEMVMEHIHPDMIPNTLFCLYYFLKPLGKLEIIVPDFIALADLLLTNESTYTSSAEDINAEIPEQMEYYDTVRAVNNEFLDPNFDDEGFSRGHQSIWTPSTAKRWLANEGYTNITVEHIKPYYLKITAIKSEGIPYGTPKAQM